MTPHRFTISVPTADLRAAFRFYRDGFGLPLAAAASGDEMPEPVEFSLDGGTHLMIVPATGFGWVLGGNAVAPAGVSECVLGYSVDTPAEVDALVERVRRAGAVVAAPPAATPWGYSATIRDLDGHTWLFVARPGAAAAS